MQIHRTRGEHEVVRIYLAGASLVDFPDCGDLAVAHREVRLDQRVTQSVGNPGVTND